MTVRSASRLNNEAVIQFDCNSDDNAEWKPIDGYTDTDGFWDYYKLQNRHSGLCLTVKNAWVGNGAPLLQYNCSPGQGNNYCTWYTL